MENKIISKDKYRKEKMDKSNKKKYKSRSRSRRKDRKSLSRSRSKEFPRRKPGHNRKQNNKNDSDSSSTNNKKRSKTRSKSVSKNKDRIYKDTSENFSFKIETKMKTSNFTTASANTESIIQPPITTTSGNSSINALALAQAAKVDRKLYIGNLPTGIIPSTLVKLLNAALISLKANTQAGDPVLSAWISTDGHYAFVEFRSSEEANNGFKLNNISILGQPLKVGRPKTYSGTFSIMEDGSLCNTVGAALHAGTMNAPMEGTKIQFPTKVICFKGITKNLNVENEEEYKDILEDFREECSKLGNVVSIHIPRKDVDDNASPGMGNIYIEFSALEEAKRARKELSGRKFNKQTVRIVYYSEEKYSNRDFEDQS